MNIYEVMELLKEDENLVFYSEVARYEIFMIEGSMHFRRDDDGYTGAWVFYNGYNDWEVVEDDYDDDYYDEYSDTLDCGCCRCCGCSCDDEDYYY